MGKITAALIIVFLIEVALTFFGGASNPNSILYSFLMSPTGWTATAFYILMIAILTGSALATVVPTSFYQVNQWALFAVAGVVMISFVGNIFHLWSFIDGQLSGMLIDTTMGGLIATLITFPFAIFYIIAIIEWTRQN